MTTRSAGMRTVLATASAAMLIPFLAHAGFISSTLGTRTVNDNHLLSITEPGPSAGIAHELNPANWFMFRVRVTHDDAQFPLVGFTSDNFSPTANNIQVCNVTGCEVGEINAGPENLDWSDSSKVTVYLEAKTCLLCDWQSFECPIQ